MRNILFISTLCIFYGFVSKNNDKIEIRNMYYAAIISEEMADTFFLKMKNTDESKPLELAYKGMSFMLQAKYAWSPYTKYSSFCAGRDYLEQALSRDSTNIEIRFLRFSIQTNTPDFLDYNDQLSNDFLYIKNNWNILSDKDLKERIKDYMKKSDFVSESDKKYFK